MGSSLEDMKGWPETPRQGGGYQLDRVQQGLAPDDWKPMKTIGPVSAKSGSWEKEAVYVLHCFQKKTQKTPKADIDKARARFRALPGE